MNYKDYTTPVGLDQRRLDPAVRDQLGTYLMALYADAQRAYDSMPCDPRDSDRGFSDGMRRYYSNAMSVLKWAVHGLTYKRREHVWAGAEHCYLSDEWRMAAVYIDSLTPPPEDDTDEYQEPLGGEG